MPTKGPKSCNNCQNNSQDPTVNFFFIYSEVFDALLIWSQYLKGFENIVKLFHYWSLNHLCFSAHSTFVSQCTPLLLRKVQKMQLCYCNSQKNFTKKCFKSTFVGHFSAFQCISVHFKIFKMKFFFNILKSLTIPR